MQYLGCILDLFYSVNLSRIFDLSLETCGLTRFLWANNQKFGKPITGLLFGPDVFMSLVMTGVLNG